MDEYKEQINKRAYRILLVFFGISVIVYMGIVGYSFFEKGKYLQSVDYELLPQLTQVAVASCLGIYLGEGYRLNEDVNEIVINSNEEYQAFIKRVQGTREDCQNLVFPEIDYSKQTLIGTHGKEWCRARLERDLRRNDRKKLYRYVVEEKLNCIPFIGCAARDCVSLHSLNLATMSKMKEGYDIQFEFYPVKFR